MSGFGVLVVNTLAYYTQDREFKPAFARRGSKAVGPVSQICGV
jgi:hypothetical protein